MKYELTQHARDMLAERQIPTEWIARVLASPARVEPSATDATVESRLGRFRSTTTGCCGWW